MKTSVLAAGLLAATALALPAQADKLDDIIASGTLRCAVVLDFTPMGSRDASNTPAGFDVDYCNDLATALGVAGITRHSKRVRFYSTIELVNTLEAEKAAGKAGRPDPRNR